MNDAPRAVGEPPAGKNGEAGASQPTSGANILSKLQSGASIVAAAVLLLAAVAGIVQKSISTTVAPLHIEIQKTNERLDRMDNRLDRMDHRVQRVDSTVQNEFRTVHSEIGEVSDRLSRLEGILAQQSQNRGQRTSDSPTPTLQLTPVRLPCHP